MCWQHAIRKLRFWWSEGGRVGERINILYRPETNDSATCHTICLCVSVPFVLPWVSSSACCSSRRFFDYLLCFRFVSLESRNNSWTARAVCLICRTWEGFISGPPEHQKCLPSIIIRPQSRTCVLCPLRKRPHFRLIFTQAKIVLVSLFNFKMPVRFSHIQWLRQRPVHPIS